MSSEDSVVVSAPSVDEAISLGLIKLTALRDEVEIEVLDEGSRGFLGLGARDAQVRVTRLSEEERQAAEPSTQPQGLSETAAKLEPSVPSVSQTEVGEAAHPDHPDHVEAPVSKEREDTMPSEVSQKPAQAAPSSSQPEPPQKPGPSLPEVVGGVNRAELGAVVRDVAAGLLQDLDVEVSLEWLREDRPTLWVAIDGKDASALVGSRARTLHALQYLFRALTYHRLDGDYNLVVDADGYRKRRRRKLEDLARRQAQKAIETGKTVRLRSMPAHERRIVHITLRDDVRVTTESVGRGRSRSVTIIPQHSESPA